MEITDIRIRKPFDGSKVKAYVSITFDDCFVVHNIKVIQVEEKTFIAMPSRLLNTGEYKDVAHPITAEYRTLIENRILEKYNSDDTEERMPDRNY